jgi:hypothetical protein
MKLTLTGHPSVLLRNCIVNFGDTGLAVALIPERTQSVLNILTIEQWKAPEI